MKQIHLYWHNYRYFQYERDFAHREVSALLKPHRVLEVSDGLTIETECARSDVLRRLVYFRGYESCSSGGSTFQEELESSCTITGDQKRQSTRYSVHGLHEYKGKFNPQIVRGILNNLDVPIDASIFDPFCGSGTTLVECTLGEFRAVGCDINPLAVYLSNAKLLALSTPAIRLRQYADRILDDYQSTAISQSFEDSPRYAYLSQWFSPENLECIEHLRTCIEKNGGSYRSIFYALASNLLREYSLQEPADLRIRRRKTPLPTTPFGVAFEQKAIRFLDNLDSSQSVTDAIRHRNRAYSADIRKLGKRPNNWRIRPLYDAAITSPPYATALPYIDTQRLSLIWLGLIAKDELRYLEAKLTGSREFSGNQKDTIRKFLTDNRFGLCPAVYEFCIRLENAVGENDGFRRQSVPLLMYRYFSDMQAMFTNLLNVTKQHAPFALVVGHNKTTLGGQVFDIDTPKLLQDVAVYSGWQHEESIPLQTYQRYSIHSQNAVSRETLVILRRP